MKLITHLLMLLFCAQMVLHAQEGGMNSTPQSLMDDAENSLKRKEYVSARYLYKQAFKGFAAQGDLDKAVSCGTETSILYRREYLYNEAFAMCWEIDKLITASEKQQLKRLPVPYFYVSQERFYLYNQMRHKQKAFETLQKMSDLAKESKEPSLEEELKKNNIQYTFTFSTLPESLNSLRPLLDNFKQDKAWDKVETLYEEMTELADVLGNQALSAKLKADCVTFKDSLINAKTLEEVKAVNDKLLASEQQVQEQADDLQVKSYHIMGLYGLAAVLIAVIVALILLTLVFIRKAKVMQTRLGSANEQNKAKSEANKKVSTILSPAFEKLIESLKNLPTNGKEKASLQAQAEALMRFNKDLETLIDLENSVTEFYEQSEFYVDTYCKELEKEISPLLKSDVQFQTDIPHTMIKTNPEQLRIVLMNLLTNAATNTESGKIVLTFKKRAAHTVQFHLMDTGCGIPEERRDTLFVPFSSQPDLVENSGLEMPICALRAQKLKGSLSLDKSYKRGSLFILEVHS